LLGGVSLATAAAAASIMAIMLFLHRLPDGERGSPAFVSAFRHGSLHPEQRGFAAPRL
jgi:hypothetical protein